MYVDFLTLACLRDHLDSLLGARIQGVVLPDDRSVGLELYAGERFYLLASARPQQPRMLLQPEKLRRGVETETSLLLLLRKWVRGGRLVDVTQPAWERILVLHIEGRTGACQLIVELVGRYSNVALVGPEGRVLEAVRHVGPDVNRYRVTLPGQPYQLPPLPPNRRPPTAVTADEWTGKLRHIASDELLHRCLVRLLLGVSPLAAREIAARATGDPEARAGAATPQALAQAIAELFAPLEDGWWSPHVALDDTSAVVAFTPYRPHQFERVEAVADISQAMWRYFQGRRMTDPYAAARQAVQALIDKTRARLERRGEKLQGQQIDEGRANDLRIAGELLLAFSHQVSRGAHEVTLTDYEGAARAIALDPQLTPVENAQRYFRRYEKARRAAKRFPELVQTLDADRAYVEQLATDLSLAESRPEIDAVREALVTAGWAKPGRHKAGQVSGPWRFEVDGFPIYVGRNARQNEQVTFQRAAPEDLWLHVRGLPGAHVVVKCGRQEVPEKVVERAAALAAYYSSARQESGKVAVDVTQRRFVHRLRGGHPGLVTYRNERTVWAKGVEIGDS